ncbi:hypothetical protein BU23DRAFT_635241 [Bimuria novae-zelandiae CBS 107.79]|uniref:C2H2-type domain-containing protein n=1 Tax=Bimuria novae-zelandiae CBS 107.79 TaxID=1447943 RepID=A0A6A5VDD0_9PLEO|nr:hypothetical protein BU23DRAFT_635241 [Bimuria novae-zelandiae CBS 107.79]
MQNRSNERTPSGPAIPNHSAGQQYTGPGQWLPPTPSLLQSERFFTDVATSQYDPNTIPYQELGTHNFEYMPFGNYDTAISGHQRLEHSLLRRATVPMFSPPTSRYAPPTEALHEGSESVTKSSSSSSQHHIPSSYYNHGLISPETASLGSPEMTVTAHWPIETPSNSQVEHRTHQHSLGGLSIFSDPCQNINEEFSMYDTHAMPHNLAISQEAPQYPEVELNTYTDERLLADQEAPQVFRQAHETLLIPNMHGSRPPQIQDLRQAQEAKPISNIHGPRLPQKDKPEYPVECPICKKKFTGWHQRGNQKRHMKSVHPETVAGAGTGTTARKLTCKHCLGLFKRSDARKKHEWRKLHDEAAEPTKNY